MIKLIGDRTEIYDKYYIEGVDCSPEVNLLDGYVSLWRKDNGNNIMVWSYYMYTNKEDNARYLYDIIPEQTYFDIKIDYLNDLMEYPENYEDFIDSMGIEASYLRKLYYNENDVTKLDIIIFLDCWQSYYGMPFHKKKSVKTFEELLYKIIY